MWDLHLGYGEGMGELRSTFRVHRRSVVLAAALILPFSAATATASVPLTPKAHVAATPTAASSLAGRLNVTTSGDVAKAAPTGWTLVNGRKAIVVGTVKQRVQQISVMSTYNIPVAALAAYKNAAASLATSDAGCHLSWTLLAGIGTVESDNGQYGGAVVLANGDTSPHILGPVLNGTGGDAAIRDTDGGRYDGDSSWDRAVGPMQFIPGTWAAYGADGNGDGISDPNNIDDAALGAGRYLCAGGGDLRVLAQTRAAVMRYNHSTAYVDLVLRLATAYAHGAGAVVPNGTGSTNDPTNGKPPVHHPAGPPANPPVKHHPGQRGGGNGGGGDNGRGGGGNGGGGNGGGGNGGGGKAAAAETAAAETAAAADGGNGGGTAQADTDLPGADTAHQAGRLVSPCNAGTADRLRHRLVRRRHRARLRRHGRPDPDAGRLQRRRSAQPRAGRADLPGRSELHGDRGGRSQRREARHDHGADNRGRSAPRVDPDQGREQGEREEGRPGRVRDHG